jgi:hypothetical protein
MRFRLFREKKQETPIGFRSVLPALVPKKGLAGFQKINQVTAASRPSERLTPPRKRRRAMKATQHQPIPSTPDHFANAGKMILCPTRDVLRSALRYFGGKWAIAPWIISHMPSHRIYVEPFGGAASVLLRKPRSKIEVYNDADDEIVGIFRVIQDPLQCRALMRLLRRTP